MRLNKLQGKLQRSCVQFTPDPFGLRRRIHRSLAVARTLMRRLEALGTVQRLRDGTQKDELHLKCGARASSARTDRGGIIKNCGIEFIAVCSLCIIIITSGFAHAEEGPEPEQESVLPAVATHINWAFSGMVTNESGEQYGYVFQMQRDGDKFHAMTALFDGQTRHVVLFDEASVSISDPKSTNWQAGRVFLRFNPINDSWIFGLKTKNKQGFNFKVDMLSQAEKTPTAQTLRPGIEAIISQTGHLNGHLQIGNDSKEQFVTAKNAWFRQVWQTEQQNENHLFSGVLCRFNDGSGFYSLSMPEEDTLRGAVSGLSDAEGMSAVISQFVNFKEDTEGLWHIRVTTPNHHLILSDVVKQNSVVAGFFSEALEPKSDLQQNASLQAAGAASPVSGREEHQGVYLEDKKSGFCMLSQDIIGDQASQISTSTESD